MKRQRMLCADSSAAKIAKNNFFSSKYKKFAFTLIIASILIITVQTIADTEDNSIVSAGIAGPEKETDGLVDYFVANCYSVIIQDQSSGTQYTNNMGFITGDTYITWTFETVEYYISVNENVRVVGGYWIDSSDEMTITSTNITMTGGDIDRVIGGCYTTSSSTTHIASTNITMTGGDIDRIYGGCFSTNVDGAANSSISNVNISISDGTFTELIGGGYTDQATHYGYSAVEIVNIKIVGNATQNSGGYLAAGGSNNHSHISGYGSEFIWYNTVNEAIISISGQSTVAYVFGGGWGGYTYVGNSSISIDGGKFEGVCAGGVNGKVNSSNVLIKNSTIGGTYSFIQSVNRGEVSSATITINGLEKDVGSSPEVYLGTSTDVISDGGPNAQVGDLTFVVGEGNMAFDEIYLGIGTPPHKNPWDTNENILPTLHGDVTINAPGCKIITKDFINGGFVGSTYSVSPNKAWFVGVDTSLVIVNDASFTVNGMLYNGGTIYNEGAMASTYGITNNENFLNCGSIDLSSGTFTNNGTFMLNGSLDSSGGKFENNGFFVGTLPTDGWFHNNSSEHEDIESKTVTSTEGNVIVSPSTAGDGLVITLPSNVSNIESLTVDLGNGVSVNIPGSLLSDNGMIAVAVTSVTTDYSGTSYELAIVGIGNSTISVTLPYSGSSYGVVYYLDGGELVDMGGTVGSGTITFNTTHNSIYIVTEEIPSYTVTLSSGLGYTIFSSSGSSFSISPFGTEYFTVMPLSDYKVSTVTASSGTVSYLGGYQYSISGVTSDSAITVSAIHVSSDTPSGDSDDSDNSVVYVAAAACAAVIAMLSAVAILKRK